MTPYRTPILFLIFARPDTTVRVFERIREIKPTRLYIAADAPREGRPDEVKRVAETRAIIDKVDWPCEVKTLYRKKNLGCMRAVSEGITWFFEQEEYGVILEDDCLPDLSFFHFSEELLIRYKDDERIGHIGGNCFCPELVNTNLSYQFSRMCHIWGWASWRRVWKNYDINLSCWQEVKKDVFLKKEFFNSWREEAYFSSFIEDTLSGNRGINTWDVQYFFLHRIQHQLCIYPRVNLVTNIGLNDPNATHTKTKSMNGYVESEMMLFPLVHPSYFLPDRKIDQYTIEKRFFSYKRFIRFFISKFVIDNK